MKIVPKSYSIESELSTVCLEECLLVLKRGGIVCVPTDTVYGLVCSAQDRNAICRMAEIKSRPEKKPFALFTNHLNLSSPCPMAEILANHFWPGPLTIVVPEDVNYPYSFNGSVGLRFPNNEFIQNLLSEWDGCLANTSLNVSGEPPVWGLGGVENVLLKVDLIIDSGQLPEREPSTVVDCTVDPPKILREGTIRQREIKKILSV